MIEECVGVFVSLCLCVCASGFLRIDRSLQNSRMYYCMYRKCVGFQSYACDCPCPAMCVCVRAYMCGPTCVCVHVCEDVCVCVRVHVYMCVNV